MEGVKDGRISPQFWAALPTSTGLLFGTPHPVVRDSANLAP